MTPHLGISLVCHLSLHFQSLGHLGVNLSMTEVNQGKGYISNLVMVHISLHLAFLMDDLSRSKANIFEQLVYTTHSYKHLTCIKPIGQAPL